MAWIPLSRRNSIRRKRIMVYMMWLKMVVSVHWFFQMIVLLGTRIALRPRYSIFKMERINYVDRLVNQSDATCVKNLLMNMRTFHKLCSTLESRGYIRDSKYMNVVEQVAVFLYILAHHEKMSVMSTYFQRSTETISRHFHMVLNGVLRLQEFKHPEPIPNDTTDDKWKYFKNCLGALDGTHIRMNVRVEDKPRSAADGRVLKDALSRKNELKVPKGTYYLVHPKTAKWKSTLLPCFKELSIIFGKDRATGNLDENLEYVVEELNTKAAGETLQDDIQPNPILDESTSKKQKKGNVESLLEAVYAASERMANQFEASTKLLIAVEEDMLLKKKQLNEELSKIPKLTILQKLQVAKRIAKDEDLMILFFAVPTEEKILFVNAILDNEI
ncbi:hypothetical protein POM88_051134 [Heracleum sosnowskyi]|uniref:DUF8040 domain-containing protein n=1 Tax=Heracleum sosnowskyi TaxID=360622 RepID=A0AAD8H015_9APIA|nr:hypothetical protein POM88_051134 [Heracleum sosnowskyi]